MANQITTYFQLIELITSGDDVLSNADTVNMNSIDISETFQSEKDTKQIKPTYYDMLEMLGVILQKTPTRNPEQERTFANYQNAQNIIPNFTQIPSHIQKQAVSQDKKQTTKTSSISHTSNQKTKNASEQSYEPYMSKHAALIKDEMQKLTKNIVMPKIPSISIRSAGKPTSNATINQIQEPQKSSVGPEQLYASNIFDPISIPKIPGLTNKKFDTKYMVLPSLAISDQITELERIIEGIRERIFDQDHFEVVSEEVISLIRDINQNKLMLKKRKVAITEIESSLWGIRDQRLKDAITLIYDRYVNKSS